MNKDKVICSCYKVKKGDIAEAVECGACCFKDVKKATKVGKACGKCKKDAKKFTKKLLAECQKILKNSPIKRVKRLDWQENFCQYNIK